MPPYPLTPGNSSGGDSRQRLLPPLGCPGEPELVWPVDAAEWLALGYRRVAVQPAPLELSWLPEACTPGSFAVWLVLRCQSSTPAAISVHWGDGSSETCAWPAGNRLRHSYLNPADVLVQVNAVAPASLQAELAVHGLQCPCLLRPHPLPPGPDPGSLQPLIPGSGLLGAIYDGKQPQRWHLRLAPAGGLRFVAQPPQGDAALALAPFSTDGSGTPGGVPGSDGAADRFLAADGHWRSAGTAGTRWWHGDGPPNVLPEARSGDFYLDGLSGQVYVLEEP